jgi:hypothetical protein
MSNSKASGSRVAHFLVGEPVSTSPEHALPFAETTSFGAELRMHTVFTRIASRDARHTSPRSRIRANPFADARATAAKTLVR